MKVRPLVVDGKIKDFSFGPTHDVTDRMFVVRRIVRINDALAEEPGPRWSWQRSGWILIDRVTGHVSQISLLDFDPDYSASVWFRDYVAYCGVSDETKKDDNKKVVAVIMQLARRKAIFTKLVGDAAEPVSEESLCVAPTWQRQPTRVTFQTSSGEKFTYEVRRHAVEIVNQDDDEGSE